MEAHLSGLFGGAATLGQHGYKGSPNFVARVLNTTVQDVADRGLCALALFGHLHLSDPRCLQVGNEFFPIHASFYNGEPLFSKRFPAAWQAQAEAPGAHCYKKSWLA